MSKFKLAILVPCALLLLLLVEGCGSSIGEPCRTSLGDARKLPRLGQIEHPEIGKQYFVDGLYFNEFEDSGIIETSMVDQATFEELKVLEAFCVRWPGDCSEIDRKFGVYRIRAIVRYTRSGEDKTLPLGNRCLEGSVEILKLVSMRPTKIR